LRRYPGFGEEKVLPFLAMMVDKKLMFREGQRYLSLAVPMRGYAKSREQGARSPLVGGSSRSRIGGKGEKGPRRGKHVSHRAHRVHRALKIYKSILCGLCEPCVSFFFCLLYSFSCLLLS
jgi:hypothetical protein